MYRILLVDDEALIREAVSENVDWEQYGLEVKGVSSAEDICLREVVKMGRKRLSL